MTAPHDWRQHAAPDTPPGYTCARCAAWLGTDKARADCPGSTIDRVHRVRADLLALFTEAVDARIAANPHAKARARFRANHIETALRAIERITGE